MLGMETCGRGHDLSRYRYPIKGGRWGCRKCRQEVAEERWGSLTRAPGATYESLLAERFWQRVAKAAPDECWLWTGARIPNGYGSLGNVQVNGRTMSQTGAHRVAFFLSHGYWPRITRHTCDNPPCVNPAHLLDGDERSNAADMVERGRCPASQRTHCPQGHEYTDENTWRNKLGHRKCRSCMRENNKRQEQRKREADPVAWRARRAARQRAYIARKRAAASD